MTCARTFGRRRTDRPLAEQKDLGQASGGLGRWQRLDVWCTLSPPPPLRARVQRYTALTVRAIIGWVVECLNVVISSSLMERAILPDGLRNSTSNAYVPEAFSEKLACNWRRSWRRSTRLWGVVQHIRIRPSLLPATGLRTNMGEPCLIASHGAFSASLSGRTRSDVHCTSVPVNCGLFPTQI